MSPIRCECCEQVLDADELPLREDGMCSGCVDEAMREAWSEYVASGARAKQLEDDQ